MNRYDDIINLPHHVSSLRKPMSMMSRAAQFAPFAALNGHEEAILETARVTVEKTLLENSHLSLPEFTDGAAMVMRQSPDDCSD